TYRKLAADDPMYKQSVALVEKNLLAELAAMPADERNANAHADDGTPIVIFNPAYFDVSLPRTAVQLITVQTQEPTVETGTLPPETFGLRGRTVWTLRHTIDYARLRAMIGQN